MSLSCSCEFDDPSAYNWYWVGHSNFKLMGVRNKRKRCCSCEKLINSNEEVMEFYRYRVTRNDIEERIHGEEVSLANSFMCEECSGLFLALDELGYGCLDISQPMTGYIEEYNEMRENLTDNQ